MSPQSFDRDRLEELLLDSREPSFSAAEHSELNDLLRSDTEARRFAAELLQDEAILSESLAIAEAELQYRTEESHQPSVRTLFPLRKRLWIATMAAACLILAFTLLSEKRPSATEKSFTQTEVRDNASAPPPEEVKRPIEQTDEPTVILLEPDKIREDHSTKSPESERVANMSNPLESEISRKPFEKTKIKIVQTNPPKPTPPKELVPLDNSNEITLGRVNSADNSSDEWKPGTELKAGLYELENGSIEIQITSHQKDKKKPKKQSIYKATNDLEDPFSSGARLIIKGPARFALHSNEWVELFSGKISAEVFPVAKGFTVTTNALEVVDLGTRFAVTADTEEKAAFHVYDGTVAGRPLESEIESIIFRSGATVQLNLKSHILEKIPFEPSQFLPRLKWRGRLIDRSANVQLLKKAPRAVDEKDLFADNPAVIFQERSEVTLHRDLKVDLSQPGKGAATGGTSGSIPAKTKVSSYLIHLKPELLGVKSSIQATIKFDSPILGIIYSDEKLDETDRRFGASRTDYPLSGGRGLEHSDEFHLHEDQRTFSIKSKGNIYDQIRILVAKDS